MSHGPSHRVETNLDEAARSADSTDRALRRAGDAPRIPGNTVTLLGDGPAVFSSWLRDIRQAKRFILLENYIISNDGIGQQIADALIERAQAGVEVYVLYDWVGSLATSREFFVRMQRAGVKVRSFGPFRFTAPLRAIQRNHRKTVSIDGIIGHVAGLCIGDAWAGDSEHGIAPWRDTAVRVEGPAAAELTHAFDETWALCGPALPGRLFDVPEASVPAEDATTTPAPADATDPDASVAASEPPKRQHGEGRPCPGAPVRVVAGSPGRSRTYRTIQILFAGARERIWITDAYFVTPPTLYEALLAAARDGVDVRVLVPGRSDLPWISWASRAGYVGLLKAGVRIFEWEGPMLHAKTTVVDGRVSRIGSSNLNLASLLTNWELDVLVEDEAFGQEMEAMFLADLEKARELMLKRPRNRKRGPHAELSPLHGRGAASAHAATESGPSSKPPRTLSGRPGYAVARAGALVLGVALRRRYQRSPWSVTLVVALLLLAIAAGAFFYPTYAGWGVFGFCLWLGVGALLSAIAERRAPESSGRRRRRGRRSSSAILASRHDPPPADRS